MSIFSDSIIRDGPVSYWKLSELSGTAAVDQMGVQNGVYTLAGVTQGAAGGFPLDASTSCVFDGTSNAVITLADNAAHNLQADICIEALIQTSSSSIMSIFGATNANLFGYNFFIGNTNPGELNWWPGQSSYRAGQVVNDGQWHHVVVVAPVSGSALFYVDGLPRVPTFTGVPTPNSYSGSRFIGAGLSPTCNFSGSISNVALYNYILTPLQIFTHWLSLTTVLQLPLSRGGS